MWAHFSHSQMLLDGFTRLVRVLHENMGRRPLGTVELHELALVKDRSCWAIMESISRDII